MRLLQNYKAKRKSGKTPEPQAKIAASRRGQLRFVVQKHDASHLHYDFRLEADGVLKSWAVPKGPSLNPEIKHLAVMVEDHPLSYRKFEGVIPEGNYGGGTVMVWDEGTYTVPSAETRSEAELMIKKGLAKGHLEFQLTGKKLNGAFDLVRLKGDSPKSEWLLIKRKDAFASKKDVLKQDRSVLSERSMQEIAEGGS